MGCTQMYSKKYELVANKIQNIQRFAFYKKAKMTYAAVETGEKTLHANIILKKDVAVK